MGFHFQLLFASLPTKSCSGFGCVALEAHNVRSSLAGQSLGNSPVPSETEETAPLTNCVTLRTGEWTPNRRINPFPKTLWCPTAGRPSTNHCHCANSWTPSALSPVPSQGRAASVPGDVEDNVSVLGVRVILGVDLLAPLTNTDQRGGDICCDVYLCLEWRHMFAHFIQLLATP